MRIDVLLDPFDATWDQFHAGAVAAVEAGFEGIWTWDHLAGSVHRASRVLECWTTLTAIATYVPGVTIGTLVLNIANRDPGTLSVMAATLQEVTGGRLVLGIGAGGGTNTPYAREQQGLGRPVPGDAARRRAVEATVTAVRQTWTGEVGGVTGYLRPDPPPPIVVGGFGPKMAELAGRVGDGFNTQAAHPQLGQLVGIARRAHEAAGRDPDRFLATAFAGLDRRWLKPGSSGQERLATYGVDRLIVIARPPYVDELKAAAPLLRG